jgi:hypothetical protein
VAHLIENLVDGRAGGLGSDVRALMLHYAQMLRRHIVSESEIAELCRRIYQKHKQALDLIFDHRPDQQATLREFLETLIKENPELLPDFSNKQCVRFTSKNWESFKLRSGQGWTRSGRILLFECQNLPDSLKVKLIIGPGPKEVREKILQLALDNQPPFRPLVKYLNKQYNEIFARSFLSPKSYVDANDEELAAKIREQWEHFIANDLPGIIKLVGSAEFLHN